jgi:hypothetical protein
VSGSGKGFLFTQLVWIGISLVISFAVNIGMWLLLGDAAFPWNILVVVTVFIGFGYFMRARAMKKMNDGSKHIRYVCNKCGTDYGGTLCPQCGNRGGMVYFDDKK